MLCFSGISKVMGFAGVRRDTRAPIFNCLSSSKDRPKRLPETEVSVIIGRNVARMFRAEDHCKSFVPVSHLGMSGGHARVGAAATQPIVRCD